MTENNNYLRRRILMISLLLTLSASAAFAQTTSFTYQGRLTDGGTPANGTYDLQLTLWDAASGGLQQPQPSPVIVTRTSVLVTGGIFTVQLDFGANAFPGADRFLEIGVRPAGGGAFTVLLPRQQITSTPYAIRSLKASSADAVAVSGVPGGSGNYVQNTTTQQAGANFNIGGNGTAQVSFTAPQFNTCQVGTGCTNISRVLSTPGTFNVFVGPGTGQDLTSGGGNTFVGDAAGLATTEGIGNAFFGLGAGRVNTTGNANTIVGWVAELGSSNLTNATAIGARATVAQSNSLVLGSINGINNATSSVNVGIGTRTPLSKLDIAATGDGAELLRFSTERPWVFRQVSTGPSADLQLLSTVGQKRFQITASDGNNVATFLADSTASKVGIGTTTPAHRLSVIGGPSWTSSFWNGSMEFSNASALGWQANTAGWHFGIGQTNGGLYFFQTSSDLGSTLSPVTYDLAITDGGNVGIGTTSPDRKLSVNGGASKMGGGSWDTFSDERLKTIKGRFTGGLKAVMQLQPLRYEYKRDNTLGIDSPGEHIGFSAQAVQKIIPEAVSKNDKGYLLINNDPIIWTMLNAIKEQQNQIEQQQNLISQQEARFARQQRQIASLKKLVCLNHPRAGICKKGD